MNIWFSIGIQTFDLDLQIKMLLYQLLSNVFKLFTALDSLLCLSILNVCHKVHIDICLVSK